MMMENKKGSGRRTAVYLALGGLVAVIILTFCGWRYYIRNIEKNGLDDLLNTQEFARHYVMITDDQSSAMWETIYESARKEGREQNAWVEMLGDWFTDEYTMLDYMNIAVAAKVDGIIVKPDGTLKMRTAIDQAEEAGIPVVTVLEDEAQSNRKSFVGINSYQLGTTYGDQVRKCMNENTDSVLVLLNGSDAGKDLVYKQLKAVVLEGQEEKKQLKISSMTIHSQNTFDAEEVIRDIFIEPENRPDILVCMNETDSERAYQAMIDYNCVGDVEIIGYYQSETMLNAIQKGIVPMAIALDTEQMGKSCIEALEEYYQMGRVNNYFSVNLDIVTQQNVQEFRSEQG